MLLALSLLLATIACANGQALDPRPSDAGRQVVYFYGGTYKVSYIIDGTNIDIAIAVRTLGWAAFGIRKLDSLFESFLPFFAPRLTLQLSPTEAVPMVNADIIMFREEPAGTFVAEDKFAVAQAAPGLDTDQGGLSSLQAWGATRVGGILFARFTRPATTGDRFDLPLTSADASIMLAFHSSSNSATAAHSSRGVFILSAGSALPPSVPGSIIAHAFLMITAFPVLMMFGSFVARFVSKSQKWWFPAHWIMELAGAILAFISFIVIVAFVAQRGGGSEHFSPRSVTNGSHQIIGLIIILCVILQLCVGLISHCTWQGVGSSSRIWPDKVHHWFGRGILLLACINIFLGIWAVGYEAYVYVVYAGLLVAIIAVFVVLQCRKSRSDTIEPQDAKYERMQAL